MKLMLLLTLAFTLLVAATLVSGAKGTNTLAMVNCEDCNNRFRFCFDVSALQSRIDQSANGGNRTDVQRARRDARRRVRSMWCIRRPRWVILGEAERGQS
jgi:hypothetical protein